MNGPFLISLSIYLTDGERVATAAYDLPVGKYATKEQVQAGLAAAVKATQEQLGPEWHPLNRHEFENQIISERYRGMVPEFATAANWDDE